MPLNAKIFDIFTVMCFFDRTIKQIIIYNPFLVIFAHVLTFHKFLITILHKNAHNLCA